VVRDRDGGLWMVYHQQKDATRGWNRVICIDPIWFDAEGVLHARASRAPPRPAPAAGAGPREPPLPPAQRPNIEASLP
jgi:hypothetical protein